MVRTGFDSDKTALAAEPAWCSYDAGRMKAEVGCSLLHSAAAGQTKAVGMWVEAASSRCPRRATGDGSHASFAVAECNHAVRGPDLRLHYRGVYKAAAHEARYSFVDCCRSSAEEATFVAV